MFVLIMSFVVVVLIILLVSLFELDITSSVITGHTNIQYSTDAGRELYTLLAAGCDTGIDEYENYNVENLISVYVSSTLEVKEQLDTHLRGCITSTLEQIAEVNKGKDREGNDIDHYMYFYITYGGQKYLEERMPADFAPSSTSAVVPWDSSIETASGDDYPKDPGYFSPAMNDQAKVQVPLADHGSAHFSSATAVLEEWSEEPWTTLTAEQQGWSDDYEN